MLARLLFVIHFNDMDVNVVNVDSKSAFSMKNGVIVGSTVGYLCLRTDLD